MNTIFSSDAASRVVGDSWDSHSAPGGTFTLVDETRWPNEDGTAESGIVYAFDACSQTPYVYDNATQIMVSYDDVASFEAKGRWIREKGVAGFEMFEAAGDYHDILLDGINRGLRVNMNGTSRACFMNDDYAESFHSH